MATVGRNVLVNRWSILTRINKLNCGEYNNYGGVHRFCMDFNFNYQTIYNIIKGRTRSLRAETLIMLASVLKCMIKELIDTFQKSKERNFIKLIEKEKPFDELKRVSNFVCKENNKLKEQERKDKKFNDDLNYFKHMVCEGLAK